MSTPQNREGWGGGVLGLAPLKNTSDDKYCSMRPNQEKYAMNTINSDCTEKVGVIFDNRTEDVKQLKNSSYSRTYALFLFQSRVAYGRINF